MVKRRILLPTFNGVALGRMAICDLPVGPRYHSLHIVTGDSGAGNTAAPAVGAIVGEYRVKINGRQQRQMTPTELEVLNLLQGAGYGSQTFVGSANGNGRREFGIYFAEPWRKDPRDQDALAWQTAGARSFQLEADILATPTTPVIGGYAIVDDFASASPGIVKWFRRNFSATGSHLDITTLDRADWYQQISIWDSSDAKSVQKVILKISGLTLHELLEEDNRALLSNYGMNPADGVYHLVLDHDDLLGSAVPMVDPTSKKPVSDLLLSLDFSATTGYGAAAAAPSGTITAIIQRLGPPE